MKKLALSIGVVVVLLMGVVMMFPRHASTVKGKVAAVEEGIVEAVSEEKEGEHGDHIPIPEAVKAAYMSSCIAATPTLRDRLVKLVDETELNAIMIDIKDYSGHLSFEPEQEELKALYRASDCPVRDMREFIGSLHEKEIYVIGRITVFQDPYLATHEPDVAVKQASTEAVWQDRKGLSFTDPGSERVWEYILEIAEESHKVGFDELNFDYVRFPSDGDMSDIAFTHSEGRAKADVLESFFEHLSKEIHNKERFGAHPPVISADLFGMTTTADDDMGIGQILERALPYFDYIGPMVYPSHYPAGFNGYLDPNAHPYDLLKSVLESGVRRTTATSTIQKTHDGELISTASSTKKIYTKQKYDKNKIRPWIQDFDYGGDYDAADVRAQIQAVYDSGLSSWMLWDPSNVYTREALLAE